MTGVLLLVRARALPALVACMVLVPGSSAAQSLYSAAGLGLPVGALDARSRSLGNVGIGLLGSAVLPSDPAAAAGLGVPGATFTASPSWVDLGRSDTGEAGSYRATRFPLMGIAYPAWEAGMLTLTFGSVLDQRYEGTRTSTVELEEGPVVVTDAFTSTGGVSEVRLSLARTLGDRVDVGIGVGRYTGSTLRALIRSLEGVSSEGTVSNFREGGVWSYSGTSLTGGAALRFGSVGRVAGSVTWSSDLSAEPNDTTAAAARSFDLPLQLRVGGSALLAPGLLLTASVEQAAWSGVGADLREGDARDATSWGVGLELTRARFFGRAAPLRLGYRSADLPFALTEGGASETAFTGGLGLSLAGSGAVSLAGFDLAAEWGERTEAGIVEEFWRAALTVRVSGF
jgi:hypothetical protein